MLSSLNSEFDVVKNQQKNLLEQQLAMLKRNHAVECSELKGKVRMWHNIIEHHLIFLPKYSFSKNFVHTHNISLISFNIPLFLVHNILYYIILMTTGYIILNICKCPQTLLFNAETLMTWCIHLFKHFWNCTVPFVIYCTFYVPFSEWQ